MKMFFIDLALVLDCESLFNFSMVNTVCTFYELTEGEDSSRQPFHGLERELLVKSLRTLEKRNQAEIFESEDGAKFLIR